ncbi:peroxide stress protein YaaA [Streptococcus sp. X16XC17]|uniref:peroxide stress protein YaaA n=1 Tax=unclassified Streptococcus TaxID=2608887 RepID=UPI00066FD048|nr:MULTISPECIES: peroxide stress protein YaaA [unclassified Streptococcus]TCD46189.1 peroxide stress protein YaaA [Streptococcus sp. X16XC17]
MKILLPNAKELNTNLDNSPFEHLSVASQAVLDVLLAMSEKELAHFFKINVDKAQLEWDRFRRIVAQQAKSYPAWQLYDGLMYRYMKRTDLTNEEINYLRQHAFITTGLYGLINVFDLISPHRLDFQGSLKIGKTSLKQYWRSQYDEIVADDDLILSLLSSEFEGVFSPVIQERMVKLVFMENRVGSLKVHSTISKKGRGRFLSYMAEQQIQRIEDIKQFNADGFSYREDLSEDRKIVFVRNVD